MLFRSFLASLLTGCCSNSALFTLAGDAEQAQVSPGARDYFAVQLAWLPDGDGGRVDFAPELYSAHHSAEAFWTMDVDGVLRELDGDQELIIPDEYWVSATEVVGDAEQAWVAGLQSKMLDGELDYENQVLDVGYWDGQAWNGFQWDPGGASLYISNLVLQDGRATILVESYETGSDAYSHQQLSCVGADCTLSEPQMSLDRSMSHSDLQVGGDGGLWSLTEGYANDGEEYMAILSSESGCEIQVDEGLQALTPTASGVRAWGWKGAGAVQLDVGSDCETDETLLERTKGSDGSSEGRSFGDIFTIGTHRSLRRFQSAEVMEESCIG